MIPSNSSELRVSFPADQFILESSIPIHQKPFHVVRLFSHGLLIPLPCGCTPMLPTLGLRKRPQTSLSANPTISF